MNDQVKAINSQLFEEMKRLWPELATCFCEFSC